MTKRTSMDWSYIDWLIEHPFEQVLDQLRWSEEIRLRHLHRESVKRKIESIKSVNKRINRYE
jgi:hypothetical protein